MPTGVTPSFDRGRYLHRSEPFNMINDWFSHAQPSQSNLIRNYILNSPAIINAQPIRDDDDFHPEFNSGEIPYLFFLESQAFLNRSLANFCAQITLRRAGYLSWATATTYYCSFFALSGLNRLQGKARIATHDIENLPRGFFVGISSVSDPKCIVFPHWDNHHKQTCLDFRRSYQNFDLFQNSFDDLLSLREEELLDEINRRNSYTYGLETGYRELDSRDYERPELCKMSAREIYSLPKMVTEPDQELAYMAKACSRIILLSAVSWKIAKNSRILRPLFDKYMIARKRFIEKVCEKEKRLKNHLLSFTRGRMRLN